MIAGTRSDLAIKLFGDDLEVLKEKGAEIERVVKSIPGAADVAVEQVTGQPVLQIQIKQDQIARYGIPARAVLDLIESVGSKPMGEVWDAQFRFPLVVRLPDEWRNSPAALGSIQLPTANGERVPLSRVADIRIVEGPSTITREWGQRRIVVTCNIRGRDLGGFVAEAQRRVKNEVTMPPGRYHVEFGGQFEQLERAQTRLMIVVPVALVLIFLLLFATYGTVIDTLRVFSGVPFAWVGGIFALWLRDMPFSISAAIGFIALSGVAVLDDMILVSYVRQLQARGADARAGGRRGGDHPPPAGPDDDSGRVPRLRADGVLDRHGGRGTASPGDRGHRRGSLRDDHVAISVACFVRRFPVAGARAFFPGELR